MTWEEIDTVTEVTTITLKELNFVKTALKEI